MLSEQQRRPKSTDSLVLYKLPKDRIKFFDEMAKSFYLQGAIRRPNRHQLGKLAMLYLGGIWKEDLKRREALAAQQNQELEKRRSPITRLDENGPMFTSKAPPPPPPTTQPRRDKYW